MGVDSLVLGHDLVGDQGHCCPPSRLRERLT
jgi:hypothetical protein